MNADLFTTRLLLRRWRDEDLAPFAALNADPAVMEHFPAPPSRSESDALIDRIRAHFDDHGYGLWALERRDHGAFLGFAGLNVVAFEAHFTPAVEVGWRLARDAWGHMVPEGDRLRRHVLYVAHRRAGAVRDRL